MNKTSLDSASLESVTYSLIDSRLGSYEGDDMNEIAAGITLSVDTDKSPAFFEVILHGHFVSPGSMPFKDRPRSDAFHVYVHVHVNGTYLVPGENGCTIVDEATEDELTEFASTTGAADLYPYLRAVFSRSTVEMGLPQLLIPPFQQATEGDQPLPG